MLGKKYYEDIILKNDKFTEDIKMALGIVKKYVVANNLIIVGGMAIDMALRLKGGKLYDDDALPDYDFYSPKYHADAYKIAEKLVSVGLKNVSVINANHVSTMRVRVNYTVVADVTYIPAPIFEHLPTVIYKDIRVIYPLYQLIDQHRALSMPYENAPWEVILHRWVKDATRYDLLYNYYPLKPSPKSEKMPLQDEIKISSIIFKDQCISGFAGLLYWHNLAMAHGFNEKTNLGYVEADSAGLVAVIPQDSHGVSIYSNDILKLYNVIKNSKLSKKDRKYNRFLDKLPYKMIIDNKWELFDNKGYMISAHKLVNDIYIANLQNIMLYMLTNYLLLRKIKDIDRGDTFSAGYLLAKNIVSWAGVEYSKSKGNSGKNNQEFYTPFLPSPRVYGNAEISDSYINAKRLFLEKIKEQPKEKIQPSLIFPETFVDGKIPEKYYKFEPSKSPILQFDGAETEKYYDRIEINKM